MKIKLPFGYTLTNDDLSNWDYPERKTSWRCPHSPPHQDEDRCLVELLASEQKLPGASYSYDREKA